MMCLFFYLNLQFVFSFSARGERKQKPKQVSLLESSGSLFLLMTDAEIYGGVPLSWRVI